MPDRHIEEKGQMIAKKWLRKSILIIGIFLLISIAWIVFDTIRYVYNLFYTNIDVTYLGKAEGAEFEKEKFTEGVYYFYEIDDVGIGDMVLEGMYFWERQQYGIDA